MSATAIGLITSKIVGNKLPRKTRALLERGDNPRSGEKVWRNSYYEGTIEHRIWKPINGGNVRAGKRWTGALLKAARTYELRTRAKRRETEPGARNGDLGVIGLEVLRYLYELVDYATGRLEPAIATIASEIGHSYSAVHDALKRLRRSGFLHWIRRSRPIEDAAAAGPQVEQVSNAYALLVPEALEDWLGRMFHPAPVPACDIDRRKRDSDEVDRMVAGMTAREFAADWTGDDLLGETLRRIAIQVDRREKQERESGRRGETGGV